MLLTILANNVMYEQVQPVIETRPGGGYIRQRFNEEIDPNIERLKRLKKEDEILLMAVRTFVENL
jgi:hypothetical protein